MKKFFSFTNGPFALLFASLMIFYSCKKDNNTNNTSDLNRVATMDVVQNDANASIQFDDVFNIILGVQASDAGEDIGLGTGGGIIYRSAGNEGKTANDARCFTVTVVPKTLHVFPKEITIDFGAGCLGKDGKFRKGKIITIYSGPMFVAGNSATTTFDNYYVDSFKIEGTHSVVNQSTANNFAWTVKVVGGKITNSQNNFWVKWDGVREHKQTEGNGTPLNLLDDVYQITGNAIGSNSNGNSWKSVITNPLVRKFTCRWIVKGQITLTTETWNSKYLVLEFGDGTCDNKATITINGVIYTIALY